MRDSMNKKGQIMMIWKVVMIMIVLVGIKLAAQGAIRNSMVTSEAEYHLLMYDLINSPDSIGYSDTNDRQYYGIVDLEMFRQENLDAALGDAYTASFKLNLTNHDKEIFMNEQKFRDDLPFTRFEGFEGTKYVLLEKEYYVMVKDGERLVPDILNVQMVYST